MEDFKLMDVGQIGIVIFGATAVYLVGRKDKWQRWGYIAGLCAQPFWFYTTFKAGQWGIFAISIWYAYSWSVGIWNYWVKK
jgi:hypothetical protein